VLTGAARASPRIVAFFDELKTLGFVEGQSLEIVVGGFDLRDDQFAKVAATLTKAVPEVVFCVSAAATRAAQEAAHTTPIVAMSPDLVAEGLAHSLGRPGGKITGVSIHPSDLDGKRQEILMDAMPGQQRMAVLANPTITQAAELQALEKAARARGVDFATFTASASDQIAPAMEAAKRSGATALNVLAAPLFSFNRRIVIDRATALGLPAIYEWPEMAEEGGLIGYGPRLNLIYRQAARLLCESPSRRQARRPANRAANQLRSGYQSHNRQGSRSYDPGNTVGARRQGDRVRPLTSANGTKRTCRGQPAMSSRTNVHVA
jgi:putative ABC transport system substrate-binding protein